MSTFTINFFKNTAERIKVDKTSSLTEGYPLEGTLREGCSITSPSILIERASVTLFEYNYAWIPEFNRYYFIDNISTESNHLWRIDMSVDVLMTYATGIKALTALVSRNENSYNSYIEDDRINFKYDKTTEYIELSPDTSYTYNNLSYSSFHIVLSHHVNQLVTDLSSTTKVLSHYPNYPNTTIDGVPTPLYSLLGTISNNNFGYIKDNLCVSALNDLTSFRVLASYVERQSSKMSYIGSLFSLPFTPSYFSTTSNYLALDDTLVVSKLVGETGDVYAQVKPLTSNVERIVLGTYNLSNTISLSSFIDFEPYTTYSMYIPFVGLVDISAEDFKNRLLTIIYVIDYVKGTSSYELWTSSSTTTYIVNEGDCQILNPVTLTTTNKEEVRNAVIASMLNASVMAITGGIGISKGQIALEKANRMKNTPVKGIPTASKQRALARANLGIQESALSGTSGIIQSFSNFNSFIQQANIDIQNSVQGGFDSLKPYIKKTYTTPIEYGTTAYNKINGRPLNTFNNLSTLSGYTECSDFHLEGSNFGTATQPELDELDSLLRGGIIL